MTEAWETKPNARRVLQHADDARPAWLWSADGQRLIWQNAASELFLAKIKKHGLKRAAPALPIKGQVARIIRLGALGRSSLARIQFLSGEKPVSATCTTTPLQWEAGEIALLIVGVDPIDAEIMDAAGVSDEPAPEVEPEGASGESDAAPTPAPVDPDNSEYVRELENWHAADPETVYAPPSDQPAPESFVAAPDADDAAWRDALGDGPLPPPDAPDEDTTEATAEELDTPQASETVEPQGRLSGLFDRLAADEALFTPLTEADDVTPVATDAAPEAEPDALDIPEDDAAETGSEPDPKPPTTFFKVTGRGFAHVNVEDPADPDSTATPEAPAADVPDVPVDESPTRSVADQLRAAMEAIRPDEPRENDVERVSRYNFDELSRILTDKIGDRNAQPPVPTEPEPAPSVSSVQAPPSGGSLINLGGETLVLNRLPLGILVFRDQQILFANRAITEMVGYESVESLRAAGLAAVFPAVGPGEQSAGPVNHLVQRDGTLVPVTARLQSMSWQGRPALMLSASTTEVRTGHEDAVRAFTQTFAEALGEGYFEANRTGVVSNADATAAALLSPGRMLVGQSLTALVGEDDAITLQAFLDRPARFAETTRPSLNLRSRDGKSNINLFAAGQAGVVSGYFAVVRHRQVSAVRVSGGGDVDPALLSRISRGIRRPLNTIIGFAELLRAPGVTSPVDERSLGYVEDISSAGQEIAALVNELDDYARLRDGRYLPQRASLDLTALLESCVMRIKDQANLSRVIVRNAISESLPRITADSASLEQAVLNLLASAIDQTPMGGAVVISAQHHDDGAIAIHVRDSSAHAVDMAERFVVFRDGVDKAGQVLTPIRSSVGLALTRSLLAVNAVSLSVDPAGADGMLFSLKIPGDLIDRRKEQEDLENK
jgi:signal transduction histidine kinase